MVSSTLKSCNGPKRPGAQLPSNCARSATPSTTAAGCTGDGKPDSEDRSSDCGGKPAMKRTISDSVGSAASTIEAKTKARLVRMKLSRPIAIVILILTLFAFCNFEAFIASPPTSFFTQTEEPLSIKCNCGKGGVCSHNTKTRHNILRRLHSEWMNIAAGKDITTWLGYGTLLAVKRGETYLQWDHDVDVVIWARDTELLEIIATTYNRPFKKGDLTARGKGDNDNIDPSFYLQVQPDWKNRFVDGEGYGGRTRQSDQPGNFVAPNARLYDLQTGYYLDIWAAYCGKEGGIFLHTETCSTVEIIGNASDSYGYSSMPSSWVFPLQNCNIEGVENVFCPNNIKNVLEARYGGGLSTPDHFLSRKTGCWEKKN